MHFLGRIAAIVGLLALVGLATAAGHVSAQMSGAVAGHVYVNDNTAHANTIGAFARHADGTLTPLAGSPFATGGAGTGTALGSQGALQLTEDGQFLLAVDAGSNEISVLRVGMDGALTRAGDGPIAAGGRVPVSIAVHGDLVYVANAGDGKSGSNYTGFRLSGSGQLSPIAGATVALPATAMPGDILFNATGTNLIGVEVGPDKGPSFIDSFRVGSDGTLTPAAGSPFPAQATGPFGSEFSPTNPSRVYVSNAHAGPNKGSVSAYDVASDGALTPISGSPYANKQTAACWVEISHDGQYLFAVNTAVPSISSYRIAANGALTLLGSTVFNNPTGLHPIDARLAPDGGHLYVVGRGLNVVSVFAVKDGNLTELPASAFALPANAAPFGIVVN